MTAQNTMAGPVGTTTDELTDELTAFCEAQSLEPMSADELWHELAVDHSDDRTPLVQSQMDWLKRFCGLWDQVQAAEDCARTGHTDTGRGVCADCGAFL